jgi:hypothetical protein
MEWPATIASSDIVIVREDGPGGMRFVAHRRHSRHLACRTYAEAEARTLAYAEQGGHNVWYASARGLRLVARPRIPLNRVE